MRLMLAIVGAALLSACATTPLRRPDVSAGYESQRISDASGRPIQLDVWYPTNAAEEAHSYNFGAGSVANGAAVAGDKLPVILLSHGSMGAASNYSWIAEPLARHGYVVLGVSHFGESPAFGQSTINPANVSHFGDRTHDINAALEFDRPVGRRGPQTMVDVAFTGLRVMVVENSAEAGFYGVRC